ncbi:MAG: hypothetical protein WAT23_08745 [Chromatiaceae bacterium]
MREMVRAVKLLRDGSDVFKCWPGGEALAILERSRAGQTSVESMSSEPSTASFQEVSILAISVASSEGSVLEVIRAGGRGYLVKGDLGAEMASGIDEVLSGNYPISPALARSLFRLAGAATAGSHEPGWNLPSASWRPCGSSLGATFIRGSPASWTSHCQPCSRT